MFLLFFQTNDVPISLDRIHIFHRQNQNICCDSVEGTTLSADPHLKEKGLKNPVKF